MRLENEKYVENEENEKYVEMLECLNEKNIKTTNISQNDYIIITFNRLKIEEGRLRAKKS